MRVFISWSGSHSHQVALALRDWLPSVIQALDPWVSSADIEKGEAWFSSISESLITTNGVGIFCLTQDNLSAPWMAFEAGALAVHDRARVATFLHGVRPDALKPPLGLFQATNSTDGSDVLKLLESLNRRLPQPLTDVRLKKAFDSNWAAFESDLAKIREGEAKKPAEPDQKLLLNEILATVRRIEKDANRRPGGDDAPSGPDGNSPRHPQGPNDPMHGGLMGLWRVREAMASDIARRDAISNAVDANTLRGLFNPVDSATEDALGKLRALEAESASLSALRALAESESLRTKELVAQLRTLAKESSDSRRGKDVTVPENQSVSLTKTGLQRADKMPKSDGEKGKKR